MNNVISLKTRSITHKAIAQKQKANNVISMAEWKSAPRPLRTASGIFFITQTCDHSGDAA